GDPPAAVGGSGNVGVSCGASSASGPRFGPISAVVAPLRAAVIKATEAQSASAGSPTSTTKSSGPTKCGSLSAMVIGQASGDINSDTISALARATWSVGRITM